MITAFYTSAIKYLDAQPQASDSLGGFVSSSPMQFDSTHNIFGELSMYDYSKIPYTFRCLALKNDLNVSIEKISIWCEFVNPYPLTTIEAGVVLPNNTGSGYFFEKIAYEYALPKYVRFKNIVTEPNKIEIDFEAENKPFLAGAYIGLWLKRVPQKNTIVPCEVQEFEDVLNFRIQYES